MRLSTFIRWVALLILLFSLLWAINRVAAQAGGWIPHLVSHLTAAAIGMVPLSIGVWHYRRAGPQLAVIGRRGVQLWITGAALFTVSQVVEAASAVIEYPNAGIIHTTSGLATMIGLLILVLGALMLLLVAVAGRQLPKWALGLGIVAAAFILYATAFGLG